MISSIEDIRNDVLKKIVKMKEALSTDDYATLKSINTEINVLIDNVINDDEEDAYNG